GRLGAAEEVDIDATDAIFAELHVAGAKTWILRAGHLALDERAQVFGDGFCGTFGEDSGFGGAGRGQIADRVDAWKFGFERARIDDDPTIFGHAGRDNDV